MGMRDFVLGDLEKATDEQLLSNYKNMKTERDAYEKRVDHEERLINLNRKRYELETKMCLISDANPRKVEPVYEFEKDPQWLALQIELLKTNSEARRHEMTREIERLDEGVAKARLEIARFDDAIPKIEAELKKRGVEYGN